MGCCRCAAAASGAFVHVCALHAVHDLHDDRLLLLLLLRAAHGDLSLFLHPAWCPHLSHLANLTTADPARPIPLADPTNPRAARLAVFSGAHKYKNLVLDQYIRDFSLAFGVPPAKPGGRSGAETKADPSAAPSIEKKVA